jgi:hypothetical protein
MATTLILITIASFCEKYSITPEQFDKATKVIANGRKAFYIVESLSTPGQEYRVEWNDVFHCLQCLPHNGEACKASAYGHQCWHKRAALAVEEHEQAKARAQRLQEQAEVESTKEYQFEQAIHEFEQAMSKFEQYTAEFNLIIEEADKREQSRRDAGRTAYNYYEMAIEII